MQPKVRLAPNTPNIRGVKSSIPLPFGNNLPVVSVSVKFGFSQHGSKVWYPGFTTKQLDRIGYVPYQSMFPWLAGHDPCPNTCSNWRKPAKGSSAQEVFIACQCCTNKSRGGERDALSGEVRSIYVAKNRYIYIYTYKYRHIHIYICVYKYIFIYIYLYIYMYFYIYIHIYIYVYMYIHIYIYILYRIIMMCEHRNCLRE